MEGLLRSILGFLPFGYAFAAGIVTMFSPCSIALLPSYVSLHLVREGRGEGRWLRDGVRAAGYGLSVTAGFVLLSLAAGGVVSLGGRLILQVVPWLAVLIGFALVGVGVWILAGGHVTVAAFGRVAAAMGKSSRRELLGFVLYGAAYCVAALSCTLPVFLLVVGSALAAGGVGSALLEFVSYALGMGLVMVAITVAAVLSREALQRWLARWVPVVSRWSGILLVGSGAYVLYYWFTVGDLLNAFSR